MRGSFADYISRTPITFLRILSLQFSEAYVNTKQKTYRTIGMVHTEGGWPKDVDSKEAAQTSRLIKRMERDEEYIGKKTIHVRHRFSSRPRVAHPALHTLSSAASVSRLGTTVEDVIKQNNAIDIYEQFFTNMEVQHSNELPEARTLTVFRDPSAQKRSASYLSYHSSGTRVAVAYSILRFQQQPSDMPLEVRAVLCVHACCACLLRIHASASQRLPSVLAVVHLGLCQPLDPT